MTTRQLLNTVHGDCALERAVQVVEELNDWIQDCENMGWTPTAVLEYSGNYMSISIGDECVWDTEGQFADAMTLTGCLSYWLLRFNEMKPFKEKLEAFYKTLPMEETEDGTR